MAMPALPKGGRKWLYVGRSSVVRDFVMLLVRGFVQTKM